MSASLVARAALALGALVSVFLLAEGLLRLVGAGRFGLETWQTSYLHRPDPDLIFSARPNARSSWRSEEFVEEVSTNSFGLRGPEPQARDARPRIVVLGDSMTFGHGVAGEETYAVRLAERFAEEGDAVEVINAGVRGYSTDQSFALYTKRLRALRPDLVVFGHYHNDVEENLFQALYRYDGTRLTAMDPRRNVLYRAGVIHESLPRGLLELRLSRVAMQAFLGWGSDALGEETHGGRPVEWSRRKALALLATLDRVLREDGGRLLVLGVPSRDGPRREYAWLRGLASRGVPVFDPRERDAWDDASLFYLQDYHFTAAGHDRLARELHRYLVDSGLWREATGG